MTAADFSSLWSTGEANIWWLVTCVFTEPLVWIMWSVVQMMTATDFDAGDYSSLWWTDWRSCLHQRFSPFFAATASQICASLHSCQISAFLHSCQISASFHSSWMGCKTSDNRIIGRCHCAWANLFKQCMEGQWAQFHSIAPVWWVYRVGVSWL